MPHFPVSIISAYRKLFKGILLLTSNVFLLDGLQFLNFLFNWHSQISMTKINLFFLPVPTWINRMNKLKFLFSHFFLLPQKEGLDTKKKRENENLSRFLFWHIVFFCFFFDMQGTVSILGSYNQLTPLMPGGNKKVTHT